MYEILQEYKKVIITFAVLFMVLVVGYGAFVTITRAGKVEYFLRAVPSDATITINGTKAQPGKLYLSPGYYTIAAAKEGYVSSSSSLYLTDNLKSEINLSLPASSDEARAWAKEHKQEYDDIAKRISDKAIYDKSRVVLNNPITDKLPFTNYLYTIDYEPDPKDPEGQNIQLTIDATDGNRASALYIIRQMGYDPTDYRIRFVDLTELF